jgi:hypothetical protein
MFIWEPLKKIFTTIGRSKNTQTLENLLRELQLQPLASTEQS